MEIHHIVLAAFDPDRSNFRRSRRTAGLRDFNALVYKEQRHEIGRGRQGLIGRAAAGAFNPACRAARRDGRVQSCVFRRGWKARAARRRIAADMIEERDGEPTSPPINKAVLRFLTQIKRDTLCVDRIL